MQDWLLRQQAWGGEPGALYTGFHSLEASQALRKKIQWSQENDQFPQGRAASEEGHPGSGWLLPQRPRRERAGAWGLLCPPDTHLTTRSQSTAPSPPRVLPLSLGWARTEACASELKVSQRARQALRMGGAEGSGENWADSHVH